MSLSKMAVSIKVIMMKTISVKILTIIINCVGLGLMEPSNMILKIKKKSMLIKIAINVVHKIEYAYFILIYNKVDVMPTSA